MSSGPDPQGGSLTTIQACVNPRLLTKASRLFTGTLEGRIIELLQNARRAGATRVEVTNAGGEVMVRDDGRGISDFAKLLDLGGSDWDEHLEASEDPAGVGLFCLAPRPLRIRSQGQRVCVAADGWRGAPVTIDPDPTVTAGTVVEFEDEPWTYEKVSPLAVFSGLQVNVDGRACPSEPFLGDEVAEYPALGCRIEVRPVDGLAHWHRGVQRYSGHNGVVNFHGQLVNFRLNWDGERDLRFLVDLTGAPTGIRLLLPARTQLVENGALEQLRAALELEGYRYIQRRGPHTLPYRAYLRARALDVELPEATPKYQIGLLFNDQYPEPAAVTAPGGWPLERCYRVNTDALVCDTDETNIHLLAALGQFAEPFIPVSIRSEYDGYSWARLPTVNSVALTVGPEVHSDSVWSGTLTCVERLRITAKTSDGREFSSAVCLAKAPPKRPDDWSEDVLVTRAAEQELDTHAIWYHLGGYSDEGDTFETQEHDFERALNDFWADLVGPDEQLRRKIMDAMWALPKGWRSIQVQSSGLVRVRLEDGSRQTMRPPQST
jgi:hypothetical protein